MPTSPHSFHVFVDPGSEVESGNPTIIYQVSDLVDSDALIARASQHPGIDVCFYQIGAESVSVRWFNGHNEIQFCGHATLALAWWLYQNSRSVARFKSGLHSVETMVRNGTVWIKVPSLELVTAVPAEVRVSELGFEPVKTVYEPTSRTILCELESDDAVSQWEADYKKLNCWNPDSVGALIIYAKRCDGADACFRYFAPWHGKPEDQATGSALRMLLPLIASDDEDYSLKTFRQLSSNGAVLKALRYDADTILIGGEVIAD